MLYEVITQPPGVTVPEWYLTGIYAFMRTQYDKFVTGLLWPLLFIIALALIPFLDRYKKFSWRDRPMVTAFGITGLARITSYNVCYTKLLRKIVIIMLDLEERLCPRWQFFLR